MAEDRRLSRGEVLAMRILVALVAMLALWQVGVAFRIAGRASSERIVSVRMIGPPPVPHIYGPHAWGWR